MIRADALNDILRVGGISLGAGLGIRGLLGLGSMMGRQPADHQRMSGPSVIAIPTPVYKNPQEEEKAKLLAMQQGKVADVHTRSDLPWYLPGMMLAGVGGAAGGLTLMDHLLTQKRKGEIKDELEQSRQSYMDAMLHQYDPENVGVAGASPAIPLPAHTSNSVPSVPKLQSFKAAGLLGGVIGSAIKPAPAPAGPNINKYGEPQPPINTNINKYGEPMPPQPPVNLNINKYGEPIPPQPPINTNINKYGEPTPPAPVPARPMAPQPMAPMVPKPMAPSPMGPRPPAPQLAPPIGQNKIADVIAEMSELHDKHADWVDKGTGAYLALASLLGLGSGAIAYNMTKANSPNAQLAAAIKQRQRERWAKSPPEIYAIPTPVHVTRQGLKPNDSTIDVPDPTAGVL